MCNVTLNNELKGIELSFNSKPEESILNAIKSNGFRWHNIKKVWYAKQSDQTIKFADSLKALETVTAEQKQPEVVAKTKTYAKKSEKKEITSLWDRVQFTEGTADTSKYTYNFVGSNYTGLSTKETLVIIRSHVKELFPECKFSIRLGNSSYTDNVNFDIVSSPYAEDSIYLKAIKNYCTKLLKSYNYDDSDSMTDYFHVHYYGDRADIAYNYTQTEQTEEVKQNILNYDKQLVIFNKAEEERKEKEFQEYLIKQKEEEAAYKIREEERNKEIEIINSNVTSNDLSEDQQYFIIGGKFVKLNKNNTYSEYQEEVEKGEYNINDLKVTREIHFTTSESLELFKNHLLSDFDFIEGTGGSYTDDSRIQSMLDYDNMSPEERKTVKFNLEGIAVYYNNQLQFIIDAQGFGYARYVGLTDDVTIQKEYTFNQLLSPEQVEQYKAQAETLEDISTEIISNNVITDTWQFEAWNIYKSAMKEALKHYSFKLNKNIIQQLTIEELKLAMYKILVEVDGIQEQFANADLKQDQKVTLFYIGGMGGLITSHITIDKVENSSYAQYDKAVKITFKQPRKHGLYYNHFYSDMLVYDGWQEIQQNVLYDVRESNGFIVTSTKFSSCDKKTYDSIIEYLQSQGKQPIVNTYKPII